MHIGAKVSECVHAACPEDTVECVPFVWCCSTLMCVERTKGYMPACGCRAHTDRHLCVSRAHTHTQIVSTAHTHTHRVHADTR